MIVFSSFSTYSLFTSKENNRIVAGFPSEFIEREDGFRGLQNAYRLNLEVREMEIGLMYEALKRDHVDVISGFSTDGKIKAFDLITLKDDKNYFPLYHAAPLLRLETATKYPDLAVLFEKLDSRLLRFSCTRSS